MGVLMSYADRKKVLPNRVELHTCAAYDDHCLLGAGSHAEPDMPDGAGITAGDMASASSDHAGYVWPSDRRVTYAEFAAGRVRLDPLRSSLHVYCM